MSKAFCLSGHLLEEYTGTIHYMFSFSRDLVLDFIMTLVIVGCQPRDICTHYRHYYWKNMWMVLICLFASFTPVVEWIVFHITTLATRFHSLTIYGYHVPLLLKRDALVVHLDLLPALWEYLGTSSIEGILLLVSCFPYILYFFL